MSKQFAIVSCLVFASALAGCTGSGGGGCNPACPSSQVCCEGMCVFTEIDRQNCGACGSVCSGTCSAGRCIAGYDAGPLLDTGPQPTGDCHPACAAGSRCCGTTCVQQDQPVGADGRPTNPNDPTSAFNNCNGCGLQCDPQLASSCSVLPGGAAVTCACGQFRACTAPSVCAMSGGQFQCVDILTDPMNCGTIGHACASGETCSGGSCGCGGPGMLCAAGQSCCAGACCDGECCGGLCTNTTSDPANCGGCGTACGDSAPNCQDSTCVCGTGTDAMSCTAPAAGNPGESCCDDACVANTDTNCGCGVVCDTAGGDSCVVSSGLPPGTGAPSVCCGTAVPIIGGFCSGGLPGFPDGGLPGFPDGGLPGFPDGGLPGFPDGGLPGFPDGGFPDGGFPDAGIDGGVDGGP